MQRNTKIMAGAAAGTGTALACLHLFFHQGIHIAIGLANSAKPSPRELVARDLQRAERRLEDMRRLTDSLRSAEEKRTLNLRISQAYATNHVPQFRQAALVGIQRDMSRLIHERAPRGRNHPEAPDLISLGIRAQLDRR